MLQTLKPEVNFCSCGCEARLIKVNEKSADRKKRQLYSVKCLDDACGNKGKTMPFPWQAILHWNGADYSEFPEDIRLPFLNLAGMSHEEARVRLAEKQQRIERELESIKDANRRNMDDKLKTLRLQLSWIEYGISWLAFTDAERSCQVSVV